MINLVLTPIRYIPHVGLEGGRGARIAALLLLRPALAEASRWFASALWCGRRLGLHACIFTFTIRPHHHAFMFALVSWSFRDLHNRTSPQSRASAPGEEHRWY